MKRKVLLLAVMVVSLIVPVVIYANEVFQAEFSDTETKALYFGLNGSAFPVEPVVGLPAGWNSDPNFDDSSWSLAFLFLDPAYLDPATIPLFIENGSNWVSISSDGLGPDADQVDGSRGVYRSDILVEFIVLLEVWQLLDSFDKVGTPSLRPFSRRCRLKINRQQGSFLRIDLGANC